MNSHYYFKDQLLTRIAEVEVHNAIGIPEAHILFRGNGNYLSMGINDVEKFMRPCASAKLIEYVNGTRKQEAIINVLTFHFGSIETWANRKRDRPLVRARQLFLWAMRVATDLPLSTLGKMLNVQFDHATVIHAIKAIEKDIECGIPDILKVCRELGSCLEALGCYRINDRINVIEGEREKFLEKIKMNREAIS